MSHTAAFLDCRPGQYDPNDPLSAFLCAPDPEEENNCDSEKIPVVFDFSEFHHREYVNKLKIDPYFGGFLFVDAFGKHDYFTPTNDPPNRWGRNAALGYPGAARILDTAQPNLKRDPDLGTPNEYYHGPGIGYGPRAGEGNDRYFGNAMFIQENRNVRIDDSRSGGRMDFRVPSLLENKLQIRKVGLLDWEVSEISNPAIAIVESMNGDTFETSVPGSGDNSHFEIALSGGDNFLKKLSLRLHGSGALTYMKGCLVPPPLPLDPLEIEKYVTDLVIPPAMPTIPHPNECEFDIAVREFKQAILPNSFPMTTVWSYGSVAHPETFNYPAFTIEAEAFKKTTVCWRNELVDEHGRYLSHLTPIDQTLHWANPSGEPNGRDKKGISPEPYTGPVPIITHVHGAHTSDKFDGYPEVRNKIGLTLLFEFKIDLPHSYHFSLFTGQAWFLPAASNIPTNYETTGTFFDYFENRDSILNWEEGKVVFEYPNDQPAATLWYHDHTLGMTRNNVYAGPAGFWLVRGGPFDRDLGFVPPPEPGVDVDLITEIPIVIQDRSFYNDGSLFFPKDRAFFEGLEPNQLQIPFIPEEACHWEPSDVHPTWNPEFFGNTIVVNGKTWPTLEVERRRYRFRFLNGCDSRFLDLKLTFDPREANDEFNTADVPFWVLGGDSSFIAKPVELKDLLLSPAERFDVIVDFSDIAPGRTRVFLVNDAPDDPFGGFDPMDISTADSETTGQVMQFVVKDFGPINDPSFDPSTLSPLPSPPDLGEATVLRQLTLTELDSETVRVSEARNGDVVLDCLNGEAFGPQSALLGTPDKGPLLWEAPITEVVSEVDTTEEWEIENLTEDAHPIHVHLVEFQILGRGADGMQPPEPWETAFKDTVIAYPGEITRIKAKFDLPGVFVWHCHILSHEDNEMMRPMFVGDVPPGFPVPVH